MKITIAVNIDGKPVSEHNPEMFSVTTEEQGKDQENWFSKV
ncbi:MAG: hypothetical protein PVF28_00080 [Thioalkalispiraceae bacterium]|jgi:hypothetical protein